MRRHSNRVKSKKQNLNSTIAQAIQKVPDDVSFLKLSLDGKQPLFGKSTSRGVLTRRTPNQMNSSLDNAWFPQSGPKQKQKATHKKAAMNQLNVQKGYQKQRLRSNRQSTSYADLNSSSIDQSIKNDSYADQVRRNTAGSTHGGTSWLQAVGESSVKKKSATTQRAMSLLKEETDTVS